MKKSIKLYPKKEHKSYKNTKIGLHCHSEETQEALEELLQKAKQENAKYVAITNYKNLRIYTRVLAQMPVEALEKYKGINLIPSIEMPAHFQFTNLDGQSYGIETHILGYGLDITKEKLIDEFVSKKYQELDQEEELKRLIKIGHELELQFEDEDVYIDITDGNRRFAGRAFMQAVMKNMEANFNKENEGNSRKLPFELRTNWAAFQNRCVKDFNSPFYRDLTELNASVTEVINLIHEMGGKAYLAHPSGYFAKNGSEEQVKRAYDNVVEFVKQFMEQYSPKNNKNCHIDGIEMYHPSYLNNMQLFGKMRNLVKLHRVRTSGGTDTHVGNIKTNQTFITDDNMGGNIIIRKLKRFEELKKASESLLQLRHKARSMNSKKQEDEYCL